MNDYSKLSERKHRIDHVETMEEASAFCQAYGEALGKYADDKEKEMDESGTTQEAKDKLIVLIVFGALITIIRLSAESEDLITSVILNGLMCGVIIPSISRCLGRINYTHDLRSRAEGFKHLDELKGLTDERALDYSNNLVDRYNRIIDDDESTIVDVYNCNYKKNPEKGANIAIASIGVLVFLMIVFCVINELNAI